MAKSRTALDDAATRLFNAITATSRSARSLGRANLVSSRVRRPSRAIIEASSSPPVKSSEMPPSSSGALLMAPLFPFSAEDIAYRIAIDIGYIFRERRRGSAANGRGIRGMAVGPHAQFRRRRLARPCAASHPERHVGPYERGPHPRRLSAIFRPRRGLPPVGRGWPRVCRLHVRLRADAARLQRCRRQSRRRRAARAGRHLQRTQRAAGRTRRTDGGDGRPRRLGDVPEERHRRDHDLRHDRARGDRQAQDPGGERRLSRRGAVVQSVPERRDRRRSRASDPLRLQRCRQPGARGGGSGRRPGGRLRVRLQARSRQDARSADARSSRRRRGASATRAARP